MTRSSRPLMTGLLAVGKIEESRASQFERLLENVTVALSRDFLAFQQQLGELQGKVELLRLPRGQDRVAVATPLAPCGGSSSLGGTAVEDLVSRPDVTAAGSRAESKKDVPMLITNVKEPGSLGTKRVFVRKGATIATLHEGNRGDNNRVTMLKPQLGHTEADEASSGLAEEDEPTSPVSDSVCVRQTHHSSSFADDVGGCGFQGGGGGEGVACMDEPAPPSVHGGGGGGGVVAGASGAASSPQSAADVEAAIARLSFAEIARRFQLLPVVLREGGADQLSISHSLLALQPL